MLAPASLLRVLFSTEVLTVVRRELNRHAEARLEFSEVFTALKDVLSKDALEQAAGITMPRRRKKRRKIKQVDAVTGKTTEIEVETDEDENDESPAINVTPSPQPAAGAPTA